MFLWCCCFLAATLAAADDFTANSNLLTSDVYKILSRKENENFLVSPFSAETVLALTHSGARDATAHEIRTSLRLPSTKELTETRIKGLLPSLRSNNYDLYTANKVYVQKDFPLRDEFKQVALDVYQADFENINFAEKAKAAHSINQWVEVQTRNKIHDLISTSDLGPLTRLILINALYFKGNWSVPFKKFNTIKKNFYRASKEAVSVDTMQQTAFFNYFESNELDAKFLELPFEGEEASLVIVLPNKLDGLANLESKADHIFSKISYKQERVNVALPKFKIESSIDFVDILKTLGIKKAFNRAEADLSGIAGGKGDLVVGVVKQKTFINVGEEGVEAAAATFVAVQFASGFIELEKPKEFIADHPFVFFIKVKDLVLFAGRVVEPTV